MKTWEEIEKEFYDKFGHHPTESITLTKSKVITFFKERCVPREEIRDKVRADRIEKRVGGAIRKLSET